MDSVPIWFPDIHMNFAENVLYSGDENGEACQLGKEDAKVACTQVREGGLFSAEPIFDFTWDELRRRVGRLGNAMRVQNVRKGDRIDVVASNSIDTLMVFLATTSIGALFSSSSTDMGAKGILDRLRQIKPRWVFMDDAAVYNGKNIDLRNKMKDVVDGMSGVSEFEGIVVQPRCDHPSVDPKGDSRGKKTVMLEEYLRSAGGDETLKFKRIKFSEPLLIVYSSGTTGQPKCIVHSAGSVILNGHKEGRLHRCLDETSTTLQYMTTGWIMYVVAVRSLPMGSRLIMYDGSPFLQDLTSFIRLYSKLKCTHVGISPRYRQELANNKIYPKKVADLIHLQVLTSTGMVLSDQLFEWVYDKGLPPHVRLDNISGGTDICAAFANGNPLLPLYVGGCQSPSLGVSIAVFQQPQDGLGRIKGEQVEDGMPGELVATKPFPNMARFFWDDEKGERYFKSYFAKFVNCWAHGDFVQVHPLTKQIIILGRSDGVLNPSGVRFGSSEIYGVIDARFSTEIAESICVGQKRPSDSDERVFLFVLMRSGNTFTDRLVDRIKAAIRTELSPRHVPKHIFETPEIPTTINLKKVELPVKDIISGKLVLPAGTLLNPQCLDFYYRFAKVKELVNMPNAKL